MTEKEFQEIYKVINQKLDGFVLGSELDNVRIKYNRFLHNCQPENKYDQLPLN